VPKMRTTLYTLCVVVLCQFGCDRQASQQAEAQRYLDAALYKLQQANSGYIPLSEGTQGDVTDLQAYRQETMDSAFQDLNKVMSLDAPQQKVMALRMSAQIYTSAARHEAHEAASEHAVLVERSTVLLGYLTAVEGSASRAASLEPQTTSATLARLQEEIDRQDARRIELQAQATDLDAKLREVTAGVKRFKAKADEGYAKAQALQEEAFVAEGERMYDLQDEASKLERQAAIEAAAAEREQVVASDLSSRLKLAQGQLALVDKLLAELKNQVKQTRVSAARLTDESAAASESKEQAAATMAQEYKQIVSVHEQAVQRRMKEASEKADMAVAELKKALSLAQDRGDKESLRVQLLAAYVDQTHLATTHAVYLDDLAHTTDVLAQSSLRLTPNAAGVYTEQYKKLTQAQADLNERAARAIEAGLELAGELAPEDSTPQDGEIVAIALQQHDRLKDYDARRNSLGTP
jgi:hypothetical protein